jgi:hypothetical protein
VSEYEAPERLQHEPTIEDVRSLFGASTPHFALHIRNRLRNLVQGLPENHPARVEAEQEIARLEELAVGGELRGPSQDGERELPSIRARD